MTKTVKVYSLNKVKVKKVIEILDNKFDTHKFIEKFYSKYEKEYVMLLYSHIENEGIFRAAHSKIGKYLAKNALALDIKKMDKGESENIKKYDSENQQWEKI